MQEDLTSDLYMPILSVGSHERKGDPMSPVTRRNLDGFAETLNRYLPGARFHVEHTSAGFTLYAHDGRTEVLFGRSKRELFDLMHAWCDGWFVGIGDDARFKSESGRIDATTVGILLMLAGFAYLAAHIVAFAMRAMDTVGGAL